MIKNRVACLLNRALEEVLDAITDHENYHRSRVFDGGLVACSSKSRF